MDPHPLQIDLVLGKVFANLTIRSLLICRQVCRQWEEISTPKLIRILNTAKSLIFNEVWDPIDQSWLPKHNLRDYVYYLKTSPRIIPSVITINFTQENINTLSRFLQKFLWKYGHTLEHFKITWNRDSEELEPSPNFLRNLFFYQCKNLKRLELKNLPKIYTKKGFTGHIQPTNVTELRIHHENLEANAVYNCARDVFKACPKLEILDWSEFKEDGKILISLLKKSECSRTLKNIRMVEGYHRGTCTVWGYPYWSLRGGPYSSFQETYYAQVFRNQREVHYDFDYADAD